MLALATSAMRFGIKRTCTHTHTHDVVRVAVRIVVNGNDVCSNIFSSTVRQPLHTHTHISQLAKGLIASMRSVCALCCCVLCCVVFCYAHAVSRHACMFCHQRRDDDDDASPPMPRTATQHTHKHSLVPRTHVCKRSILQSVCNIYTHTNTATAAGYY